MESCIKKRLVEAAEFAQVCAQRATKHRFIIEVLPHGIRISYLWKQLDGHVVSVDNYSNWITIEQGVMNPLILAMKHMLKAYTQ